MNAREVERKTIQSSEDLVHTRLIKRLREDDDRASGGLVGQFHQHRLRFA